MESSGASQNTSILAEVMPNFKGVSQLPAGSPNKNGVPAMCSAATDPVLHSSTKGKTLANVFRLSSIRCSRAP